MVRRDAPHVSFRGGVINLMKERSESFTSITSAGAGHFLWHSIDSPYFSVVFPTACL